MRSLKALLVILVSVLILSGCMPQSSDWTRRDMPTDGLDRLVTYNLNGPAGSESEKNVAMLRGVNENAPLLMQETIFSRMSGSKTQDIQVTLPNGNVYQALGEVKTQRFAGLTNYMSLEIATVAATDIKGSSVCGAKIRLQFNRNLIQYSDPDKRDWDSLWYYDVPCQKTTDQNFIMQLEKAKLRALVLNEVWQFRIASGSYFFNWGHSVTAVDGLPRSSMSGPWWLHWDLPNSTNDTMGAYQVVNNMVKDLESSPSPWVEFAPGGEFDRSGTYLIYSAGDADQYANWNRLLLNRQEEYAVLVRSGKSAPWNIYTIKPLYNYEWNDVSQVLAGLKGWNKRNPMHDHLDSSGNPKRADDSVIKELERIGWQNAPNASLEQIQVKDVDGDVLYTMTVRAFIGANDSLVMFGPAAPPSLASVMEKIPQGEKLPLPVVYDKNGDALPRSQQPYTSEQWAEWQRESTMWNFLRDNPKAVGAELMVQMRQKDDTTWKEVMCGDMICGFSPIEWNLSSSYYFSKGDVKKPWVIYQLLGEVGVRTLGMSYNSGRYQGTGMLFAMAQIVHRDEFFAGYQPESIWTLDSRASQLPDRLSEAVRLLNK